MKAVQKLLLRIERGITRRLLDLHDSLIDRRICGQSLVPYVPSIDRDDKNGTGGTGSQSTHYVFLKKIFAHVGLTASDVFMDVGCGKGRVLAFLIREKCPCPLYGIEHNESVGKITEEWTRRYEQVHIVIGDALTYDYNPFTVLSLARSLLQKTFVAFVEHLEQTMTHPIRLIFWYGQERYCDLDNRPGWTMERREQVGRPLSLLVGRSYSIWSYEPVGRNQ